MLTQSSEVLPDLQHQRPGCTYKNLLLASLLVLGLELIQLLLCWLLRRCALRCAPGDVELLERAVDGILNGVHGDAGY